MPAHLELKGIVKSFGKENVLDGMDLSVEQGKILAILGPSGCGKSTTLRVIAGLVPQDSGEVRIDGRGVDQLPANKRNVGFVFQNYSLFPHLNVRRNIEFGMRLAGSSKGEQRESVAHLLSLVGLEGIEEKRPNQLSGGQQQRVALARALAVEPKLLLLDEPFGALDAKIRRRIRRDLKRLQRELGLTMVFVTHDQEEAFEVGDQIAVMNNGRIEQVGLPRDLYDSPQTSFVANFIGTVNVIEVPGEGGDECMDVMVRPEDVVIERVDGDIREGVQGVLAGYIFLGPSIEVMIDLDNGETIISFLPKAEFIHKGLRRGDRVRVRLLKFRSFPKGG